MWDRTSLSYGSSSHRLTLIALINLAMLNQGINKRPDGCNRVAGANVDVD